MRTLIIVLVVIGSLYFAITTLHKFLAGDDGQVFEAEEEEWVRPQEKCQKACSEELDECKRLCKDKNLHNSVHADEDDAKELWCTQECKDRYTDCLGECSGVSFK